MSPPDHHWATPTSPQALYSFRPATPREWRSHQRSEPLRWLFGGLMMGAIALTCYVAFSTGFDAWDHYRQSHLSEFGNVPRWPNRQAWSSLLGTASAATLPFLGLMVVILALYKAIQTQLSRQRPHYQMWIAAYRHQASDRNRNPIIGHVVLIPKQRYTLLTTIYIAPEHRGQGVGSHLLWHSLASVQRPVYLICTSHLQRFYRRLGFVGIPTLRLPPELKRSLTKGFQVMKLSLNPIHPSPIRGVPFSLDPQQSVQLITDLNTRFRLHTTLWKRRRFRRSRYQALKMMGVIGIAPLVVSSILLWLLPLITGAPGWNYFDIRLGGLQLSTLAIAIGLVVAVVSGIILLFGWQEWIVQERDRTIAYAHFSAYPTCSVLHYLHIEPQYPQSKTARLLFDYFSHKVRFPLYLACPKRQLKFYRQLGFTPIKPTQLPFILKIILTHTVVPLKLTRDVAMAHPYQERAGVSYAES